MADMYQVNLQRLGAIAIENGFVLNPNEERVMKVVGMMAQNYELAEEWVCPCKQTVKPAEKGKDTVCPCPEWKEEIKTNGHCFCKLFYSSSKK